MKVLSTWIAKGGVGKSTLTGNLSYYLQSRGKVLLVDADPQGNLSGWLHPDAFNYELADVLGKQVAIKDAIISVRENIDLLGTFAIGGSLKRWSETVLPSQPFAFHDLKDAAAALGYDYLIFDCSPGLSILERSLLGITDQVLPIVRPEYFSFDGIEVFKESLENVRKELRSKVGAPYLIVNGLNLSFGVHKSYYEALKEFDFDLYTIGQTTKATEAQTAHKFLAEYDPENKILSEYKRLAEAV